MKYKVGDILRWDEVNAAALRDKRHVINIDDWSPEPFEVVAANEVQGVFLIKSIATGENVSRKNGDGWRGPGGLIVDEFLTSVNNARKENDEQPERE